MSPAIAQVTTRGASDPALTVTEITVTAQKRSENIQDVPMSITAFSGERLERSGMQSFEDYAIHVPNLSFGVTGVAPGDEFGAIIRGIDGGAGFYLDETALPTSIDPRIVEVDHIEILRGPQGTLYGASAMSGAIRMVSKEPDPTAFSGQAHAIGSVTNHGGTNGSVDAGVNIPVVADKLAIRVLAYYDYQSGTYDRAPDTDPIFGAPVAFPTHKRVDSRIHSGGQIATTLKLFDGALSITPRFMFGNASAHGESVADTRPGNFIQRRMFDFDGGGHDDWRLYTLTAKYELPIVDIISATSVFNRSLDSRQDFSQYATLAGIPDAVGVTLTEPLVMSSVGTVHVFSQEVRAVSKFDGPIRFTLGGYYRTSDATTDYPVVPLGGFNVYSAGLSAKNKERALFGEGSWDITERLTLTVGLRYFENETSSSGFNNSDLLGSSTFAGKSHETGLNPKYVVRYRVNDDAQVYATAARGFRTGGANTFNKPSCAADIAAAGLTGANLDSFKSDTLWNYEIGAKTDWLDRRLQVNAALYHIEQTGLRQGIQFPTCGQSATVNVGEAKSEGGELEIQAVVTEQLKLTFGAGYTNARITAGGKIGNIVVPVPVGQRTQQVPEWNFSLGLNYNFDLFAQPSFLQADYAYVGSSMGVSTRRDAYHMVDLRVGTELGRIQLALFAKNLFDVAANLSDASGSAPSVVKQFAVTRPRTIGIDARIRF